MDEVRAKVQQLLNDPFLISLLGVSVATSFLLGRYTASNSRGLSVQAAAKTLNEKSRKPKSKPITKSRPGGSTLDIAGDEASDDETGLAEFSAFGEECKMVLVVRTDLGMTKGM